MTTRFALFDSLRGTALMAVIAFHVASLTGKLGIGALGRTVEALGDLAVLSFFAVSGFLLYRPFVAARVAGRDRLSFGDYGIRRVLRIVPAYWTALTVLAIFPGIVGVFSGDWWRYYGYLQLYWEDSVGRGIPVAWTLCVEVTFYLALPLWVLLAGAVAGRRQDWWRRELAALAAIAASGAVMQVLAAREVVSNLVVNSLPGQTTWFALGMALAVVSIAVERGELKPRWVDLVIRRPGLCWAGAGVALVGLAALVPDGGLLGLLAVLSSVQPLPEAIVRVVLRATFVLLFMLPAVFGERAGGLPRRVLALPAVTFVGTISYSVYLYHLAIAQLLILPADPAHFSAGGVGLLHEVPGPATVVLYALTLGSAVAVGAVSYRLVELPFLRRKPGRRPARAREPVTARGPAG